MKIFQVVQKNFAILGISPNQSYWNVNSKMAFFTYNLNTALGIMFLFLEANTFLKYTMNIYVTATVFLLSINHSATLFQKEKLFKLIDEMEKFGDESKYQKKNILKDDLLFFFF